MADPELASPESNYADEDATRRSRRAWLITLLVVPLVAALVVVVANQGDSQPDGEAATSTTLADEEGEGESVVELSPQAPWNGADSLLLPVNVEPATGLVDGQTVTVTGAFFPPNSSFGVVMCTTQAVEYGVSACDIGNFTSGTTAADGTFTATFPVRRYFSVAGQMVDCLAGNIEPADWMAARNAGEPPLSVTDPTRFSCIVAVGLISDYDQSGGFPISFEGAVTGPDAPAPATVPPVEFPDCPDYSVTPPTTTYEWAPGSTIVEPLISIPMGCPPAPPGWWEQYSRYPEDMSPYATESAPLASLG
jgi:hypothetical protein